VFSLNLNRNWDFRQGDLWQDGDREVIELAKWLNGGKLVCDLLPIAE
jgi:hypothetical protein